MADGECEHDWHEVGGEDAPVRLQMCVGCEAHRVYTSKGDAFRWMRASSAAIKSLRELFVLCGDPGIEHFAYQIMLVQAGMIAGMLPSFSDEDREAARVALGLTPEKFDELVDEIQGPKGQPC